MRTPLLFVAALAVVSYACSSAASADLSSTGPLGVCVSFAKVTPTAAALNLGEYLGFTATFGCDSSARPVRWRSSAPAIATVDSLTGVVHAVAVGSATIIAATVADPTVIAAASVAVTHF